MRYSFTACPVNTLPATPIFSTEAFPMNSKVIYIADDEINICNIIKSFLVREGFIVETFSDGKQLLDAFVKRPADLLILDIMMPEIDGYSLCAKIRSISNVPIIIVSAKDSETDRIAGLTLGSDDYMTKPFSPLELVARVKSLFRRIELDKTGPDNPKIIDILDITIHSGTKSVMCNGKEINLTVMEYNLLLYLVQNKNKVVSREELLNKVWGFESKTETRATDDTVKRVRKKLEDAGSCLKIKTIWGYGFKIEDGG